MKPINAWTREGVDHDGYAIPVDELDELRVFKGEPLFAKDDPDNNYKLVTILPGHLAESLRWRKVGEEEPEVGKRYVVQQGSIVTVATYGRRSDGVGVWGYRGMPLVEDATPFDIYRPAIPGIDYVEGA